MEKSLIEMKNKLVNQTEKHKKENIDLMEKNMMLIKEVSELRTTMEEIRRSRQRRMVLGLDVPK